MRELAALDAPSNSAIPVLLMQKRMLLDAQQRRVQVLRVVQVFPCRKQIPVTESLWMFLRTSL
jgi:hypothetical protein